MGNPDAGSSDYHHQAEYELQPQEYQYEATHEAIASHDQNQFQPNDPQARSPPVAQLQQQQPAQYPPPQTNQAYGAQPARSVQFPPPSNQMGSDGLTQHGAYSQQGPRTVPAKPVQFPPPSAQNNHTYPSGLNHPGAFPPYGQQPMPVQQTPVSFPPPAPQASPGVQFQLQNGPQVQYGTMPTVGAVSGFPVQSQAKAWSSGLFDCMNDPMNALVTAFFPCLTFGQLAEIVDDGHTSCGTSGMLYGGIAFCIGLPCIMSCTYRTKLRNKFGLPEAPAPDWVTHFLCEWCALCQEYRELQARGWDPSIGWQGNVMRNQMQQATMMAAPMNQRMMA